MLDYVSLSSLKKLSLSDTFSFTCKSCGKCCCNRDATNPIMIKPSEVYRLSKYLNISTTLLLERYCQNNLGSNSNVPIVHLKSKTEKDMCIFFNKNRCRVYSVKPTVCSLYPLGKIYAPESLEAPKFFFQELDCQKNVEAHEIRVSDWLDKHNVSISDSSSSMFYKLMTLCASNTKLIQIYTNSTTRNILSHKIYDSFLYFLYCNYNLDKPFLEQFRNNLICLSDKFPMLNLNLSSI